MDVQYRAVSSNAGRHATEQGLVETEVPAAFLLSVVIPVYNEEKTLREIVQRLVDTKLPLEIILVDDGSTDLTAEVISSVEYGNLHVLRHDKNLGKGAALRTGFQVATGDAVLVQDADLEYDPRDLHRLLPPLLRDEADVVYGNRFSGAHQSGLQSWHATGNRLLTRLTNVATGVPLQDVATCYKLIRRDFLQRILPRLRENRFGIDFELTSRLAHVGARFAEQPIQYCPRWYGEGKKIGWRDGVAALWCIFRYNAPARAMKLRSSRGGESGISDLSDASHEKRLTEPDSS